jgi:hypothetical protein
LFGDNRRDGIKSRPSAACENDAFH